MKLEVIKVQPETVQHETPLLFVHGAWHGAWCWEEHFLPYFSQQGFKTYALSLRGHGKSENNKSLRWTGAWDYVADVNQVAGQIAAETGRRPALIGHSMGGYVVQKYLEKHDTPAAVLLASIPSRGALPFLIREFISHPLVMLKCTIQLRTYPIVETVELAHSSFFSKDMPAAQVKRYQEKLQDEAFRMTFDSGILHRPNPQKVNARNIPMLVLGAANDTVFPVYEVEATARAYKTQAVIIPDITHDIMLDRGWERVAEPVSAWLKEKGL